MAGTTNPNYPQFILTLISMGMVTFKGTKAAAGFTSIGFNQVTTGYRSIHGEMRSVRFGIAKLPQANPLKQR